MFVRENQEGFFNSLGFHYFGPINGHDLKALEHTLEAVKQLDEPVVVHVLTKKDMDTARRRTSRSASMARRHSMWKPVRRARRERCRPMGR